jgi:hypothetical protein
MVKIRNETIRTKIDAQRLRWYCHSVRRRTAELIDRLQNGGTEDQSTHGRTGLGIACKAETSRMKNISIKSSGGEELYLRVEENCIHRKNPLIIII